MRIGCDLTYLILRDDKVATISVAPIHLVVLTTLPPSCSHPWRSKPFCHAASISRWILGMEGINGRPGWRNDTHRFIIRMEAINKLSKVIRIYIIHCVDIYTHVWILNQMTWHSSWVWIIIFSIILFSIYTASVQIYWLF